MNSQEKWECLVAGARAMMSQRQSSTFEQYGVDYSTQYDWDLDSAEIVFSRKGVRIVRADLEFLGSIVQPGGTWLWGWANKNIPPTATSRSRSLRRYGEEHGFAKLTRPEWNPVDSDGHDVMIVSASILGFPAFFHDHASHLALFFALDKFRRIEESCL